MNNRFYKIGIAISIILIGTIGICLYIAKKEDKQIAKTQENLESVMSSTNTAEENKNEFEEIKNNVIENNKNVAENLAEKKKENTVSTKKEESNQKKSSEEVVKEEENKNVDPVFTYPVEGEVIQDYAKEKLVYSNTLGEWVTHLGIDIKADKTTVVKASAEGTIKSIKTDPRYGLTVVIEHNNGFCTVYSNLLTAEFVKEGEKVKSGQTIGTVGNTASFEILDEPHLHFEILKDNEQIDPNMYLKK